MLYFISASTALKHSGSTKFRVFSTVFFLMGKYFIEILNYLNCLADVDQGSALYIM